MADTPRNSTGHTGCESDCSMDAAMMRGVDLLSEPAKIAPSSIDSAKPTQEAPTNSASRLRSKNPVTVQIIPKMHTSGKIVRNSPLMTGDCALRAPTFWRCMTTPTTTRNAMKIARNPTKETTFMAGPPNKKPRFWASKPTRELPRKPHGGAPFPIAPAPVPPAAKISNGRLSHNGVLPPCRGIRHSAEANQGA